MATNKIFRVGVRLDPGAEPTEHLIRAATAGQAQQLALEGRITVEVATPEDLIRLTKAGVELQDAGGAAALDEQAQGKTTGARGGKATTK